MEAPSVNAYSNAKTIAKLAALLAGKGTLDKT